MEPRGIYGQELAKQMPARREPKWVRRIVKAVFYGGCAVYVLVGIGGAARAVCELVYYGWRSAGKLLGF